MSQPRCLYRSTFGIGEGLIGKRAGTTAEFEGGVPAGSRIKGYSRAMKIAATFFMAFAVARAAADTNDYPTEARADYVFVCLKTNGETQEMLRRCSCSINVIASLLPYDRYVAAQTVASMNQVQGQIGTMFRASQQTKAMLNDLRRAQAEAEIRCF